MLDRTAALLKLICEIEAHADQRIFANDCANSKLTTIRGLARSALAEIGHETNPLFPTNGKPTPTDRWHHIEQLMAAQ